MVTKNQVDTCHGKVSKYGLWILVSVCIGSRILLLGTKKRILVDKDGVIGRGNEVLSPTALESLIARKFLIRCEDNKTLRLTMKGVDVATERIRNGGFVNWGRPKAFKAAENYIG